MLGAAAPVLRLPVGPHGLHRRHAPAVQQSGNGFEALRKALHPWGAGAGVGMPMGAWDAGWGVLRCGAVLQVQPGSST